MDLLTPAEANASRTKWRSQGNLPCVHVTLWLEQTDTGYHNDEAGEPVSGARHCEAGTVGSSQRRHSDVTTYDPYQSDSQTATTLS